MDQSTNLELIAVLLRADGVAEFVGLGEVGAEEAFVSLRLRLQIHVPVDVRASLKEPEQSC